MIATFLEFFQIEVYLLVCLFVFDRTACGIVVTPPGTGSAVEAKTLNFWTAGESPK